MGALLVESTFRARRGTARQEFPWRVWVAQFTALLVVVVVATGCAPAPAAPTAAPVPTAAPTATTAAAAVVNPAATPSPAVSAVPAAAASPASASAPTASKPAAAAGALTKVTVGYSEVYEGALPLWYAQESGLFKKNGLEADLQFIASSTGIAALLSGQTQVFQGGGSQTLSANVGGAELLLIGNLVPVYPYVFEVSPEIKTLDDLRGKKVGVSSAGSTSDIATRVLLRKVGLDPDKDVQILAVGSSQNRTAALLNGSIQAGLDQPPGSLELEARGFRPLFDLAALKLPVVNNGIVVQRAFAASNRDTVQRYVDSIVESIAALRKDKPGAVDVLMKNLKIEDRKTAETTYDYAVTLFPGAPTATAAHLGDSVDELSVKNPRVREYDLSRMLDESFVKSAVDRGLAAR